MAFNYGTFVQHTRHNPSPSTPTGLLLSSTYFSLHNFSPSAPTYQSSTDSTMANFSTKKATDKSQFSSEKGINLFKEGYARQNRYLVEITPPKVLREAGGYDTGKIGLLCNSVSLPSKMVQVYEQKNLAIPYRVPYTLQFDPIPMSFYCDSELEVRRFFDSWQKGIVDERTGVVNFYDEYVTTIVIHIVDTEGFIRYSIKLTEAYPLMLSTLDMSYASNNTPLVMNATFAYRYWHEMYRK